MKTRTSLMAIEVMAALMTIASAVQAASPPASLVMIPPQINYQGRLVTPANVPYNNTNHSIDLSLYPTASGGIKLWSERYTIETRDGYFSVNLGSGGAAIPGSSNPPIWQVLWKTDVGSPDTFFMALTVRTETNGNTLASPVEATPRQQFLTTPFAYRAHQSVYATKADGLFSAPLGVQTASLSSTTNDIGVNAPLRLTGTPAMTINQKPLFVRKAVSAPFNTSSRTTQVPHGIDLIDYDVVIAGWHWPSTSPGVQSVYINPGSTFANVVFSSTPTAGLSVTVWFLGIPKGLTQNL